MRIYKPNAEIEYDAYVAQKLHMIKNEIRGLRNEYILNVNQEDYFNQYRAACNEITTRIAETDKAIDARVYALYGLTAEEIALIER